MVQLPEKNRFVGIDRWGYTSGDPIGTIGAGFCMNMVVHRIEKDDGVLVHIHNSSNVRSQLYYKVQHILDFLVSDGGPLDRSGPYDIYLGGGYAFGEDAIKMVAEPDLPAERLPVALYIQPHPFRVRHVFDCRSRGKDAMGTVDDVIYAPPLVYRVSNQQDVKSSLQDENYQPEKTGSVKNLP